MQNFYRRKKFVLFIVELLVVRGLFGGFLFELIIITELNSMYYHIIFLNFLRI
jgi:membrane protein CcdC involved in cytochrome C biogenesis